jgi:hypothetical protein
VDTDASSTSTTRTTLELALPGDTSTSTSSTLGTATTSAGGGAGGSSTTSTTARSTASTTRPDEDTNDPACSPRGTGAAAEGNQAMRISFCIDDGNPKVGQQVRVSGTAVDPDAQIEPDCIKASWEGEQFGECVPGTVTENPVINREFSFTHTYTKPGTYTIHVGAISDAPKSSFAETTLKITVHA